MVRRRERRGVGVALSPAKPPERPGSNLQGIKRVMIHTARVRRCVSQVRQAVEGVLRAVLILFALVLVCPTVAAQPQPTPTAIDPDSALAATLRRMHGEPLQLERAVRLALENATDVREARAALRAATAVLQRERGTFDPELFADVTATSTETPSSSPFSRPDVIEDRNTITHTGARMLLPFGTEIEASVEARKLDTNSEFAAIDPQYRADGRLEVRHPILKGFGPGTSSERTAAERELGAAQAGYRGSQLNTRALVETTYWSLYAAERDLAVQQLIVERAEALLQQARLRAGAGLVGPNEVANARVFLAEQRLSALDQEERLDAISDQLVTLLGVRPRAASRYRAVDAPPSEFPVDDIDTLLARTFRNNESLIAAQHDLQAIEARAQGAKWNALPELDFVGALGGTGLSGDTREVIFGGDTLRVGAQGAYGEALGQALGRDFPNWSVGVELTFPIPLRSGRGERSRVRAEVELARQRVEAVRRRLEERVRAAHRELVHSRERLDVAEEGVDASFEQVRIGLIEYDNGRTTAFELVRLGADLAGAQKRLSEALVRAATAAADLRYLTAQPSDSGQETNPPGR